MDDDKKVVDPTTNMLSEFAKLIQEGKKAKEEAEAKKKQTFFEKYKIENTELNPFSFISELAKLKHEAETPEEEIIEQPEMVAEEVLPEPVVEEKKQTSSELLAELASLIQQGKQANKQVFEEQEEHLEPFVAEVVQEIVELQQEEIKEEPKPVDLISRTVESITKIAEQNKVNEVTNLFSTPEPEKTSPNFKAIQTKLKSLEQWVSKISTAGAGSGSYWLNDLGDTDKNSLQNATDGQVLTFSADIGKWTAQDSTGGAGTVDTTARTIASSASANTVIIQGVDVAQNTRIGNVETSVTNLQNVNLTQNTNITTVTGIAQAAFDKANTFVDTYTDQYARDRANGAVSLAQSAYDYANTIVSDTQVDPVARNTANNASSNTIIIQGIDATQNTNITAADGKAQAAFNKANTAITTSGGTITGRLNVAYAPETTVNTAVTITAANTVGGTGYADLFKFTNTSAGAINPNKFIRLGINGTLEIINSAYNGMPFYMTDSGDVHISGNTTTNGIAAGYAPNRPGFRVTGNGASISASTTVAGGYLVVDFNQGNYLNTSTGIFTAPVAGLYQVNIVVRTASNSNAGINQVIIRKTSGGTTISAVMVEFGPNTSMNHAGGSTVIKLAVGDTLKFDVTAGSISFDGNDNWSVAYLG